ncbi:MAG: helix-turn-helix domain-containing protein [Clostridiales bacterium]|nr:helix-turn-helix domain-containing protein [Clostridiales bacterium]
MKSRFYTVKEVANRLRVSVPTVYQWVETGKLGAIKVKGVVRITEEDVDEFIKKHRTQ